jgi:hypothetical protein
MSPLFRSITQLLGVMGEWRSSDYEMRQRVEVSHAALASGQYAQKRDDVKQLNDLAIDRDASADRRGAPPSWVLRK